MTEIEKKALALVNEVSDGFHGITSIYDIHTAKSLRSALCLAIEQHEAFRQEVSDAVETYNDLWRKRTPGRDEFMGYFIRFILPKPVDPLVNALAEAGFGSSEEAVYDLRAALAKRGFKIVEDTDAPR